MQKLLLTSNKKLIYMFSKYLNKKKIGKFKLIVFLSFFFLLFSNKSTFGQSKLTHVIEKKFILKENKISKKYKQIISKQNSVVSKNTAYFVDNVFFKSEELKKIPRKAILSVKVIQTDTVINSKKYDAQILVFLKNNIKK
mgnify:CR=1 FL=1